MSSQTSTLVRSSDYTAWLKGLKAKIHRVQVKVAIAANRELIRFYYELGGDIYEKQKEARWGIKLFDQLSKDLQKEFPGVQGLSKTNLKYCSRFYQFYAIGQQGVVPLSFDQLIGQQPVDPMPWGHNIQIFTNYSAEDIAAEIGKTPRTVENYLAKLKQFGVIARKGPKLGGHWEVIE